MYLFQLQNLETPVWISLHIGDFAFELITGVEWTNQNTRKVTSGVLKEIMREITFSLLSLYWSLSRLIMEQSLVTRGNRMHTNNHECFVLTLFFLLTGNSEHTVTNSAHFLSTFSIVSFDVESLFTRNNGRYLQCMHYPSCHDWRRCTSYTAEIRERPKPCRLHNANASTDRWPFELRIEIHIIPV